jgi:hypothetical protein
MSMLHHLHASSMLREGKLSLAIQVYKLSGTDQQAVATPTTYSFIINLPTVTYTYPALRPILWLYSPRSMKYSIHTILFSHTNSCLTVIVSSFNLRNYHDTSKCLTCNVSLPKKLSSLGRRSLQILRLTRTLCTGELI